MSGGKPDWSTAPDWLKDWVKGKRVGPPMTIEGVFLDARAPFKPTTKILHIENGFVQAESPSLCADRTEPVPIRTEPIITANLKRKAISNNECPRMNMRERSQLLAKLFLSMGKIAELIIQYDSDG